ncbi:hypothetical protein EVAR_13071_1 [Eumeta japonica]|uniref:Uncharacterized protein n=1 Tax=Eumeta variegata TaxID=151549 RepID=A0A4C2A8W5_EUMVA|nr:hypothetical protein EVAR_13071_1 [Eumeta japonica]
MIALTLCRFTKTPPNPLSAAGRPAVGPPAARVGHLNYLENLFRVPHENRKNEKFPCSVGKPPTLARCGSGAANDRRHRRDDNARDRPLDVFCDTQRMIQVKS